MSFSPYKNYQEILINFQTERHDDFKNSNEQEELQQINDNMSKQQHNNNNQKSNQGSSNSIPTKSSPLSRKNEEMMGSQFSFNQKNYNQSQKIVKNHSQSSLGSQQNGSNSFQQVSEDSKKSFQMPQNQKQINISSSKNNNNNSSHFQIQNIKDRQQQQQANDQIKKQQQPGIYLNNYKQRQIQIQNDFSLNNQEKGNNQNDSNKKKPSPLKLSPTMKPIIGNQQKRIISDFENDDVNQKDNSEYNYFQQFESFSGKNDFNNSQGQQKNQNITMTISEISQQEREERLLNLQKKYIDNFDDKIEMTIEQLTIDSHSSNDPRISNQDNTFLHKQQSSASIKQYESPMQFQDISQDTARRSLNTKGLANNSFFRDALNNLNEKSTCRNNYGQSQEESMQQNVQQFSQQSHQKSNSANTSQADYYYDIISSKGQKSSNKSSYIENLQQQSQSSSTNQNQRQAEKENNFNNQKEYNPLRNIKENLQIDEDFERKKIQRETIKAFESQKLSDMQVLISEKILLQQELNQVRLNLKESIQHYEGQISSYKGEIQQLKELIKIQELNQQDQTVQNELRSQELILHKQLEIEAQKEGKNEQLLRIIKKIQNIDIQTESVFAKKLEQERREKQEIIEKNLMLQQEIQGMQNSLNYCKDYVKTSEDAQMRQNMQMSQEMLIQIESKDQQIIEERRQHKQQLNMVNDEIKRITEDHQKYIQSTEKQIANIEIFYKKQLDEFKKTYEASIQKTKCITDEFDRLMQESTRNKELLTSCQKQLKNCEIRNSQLTESNMYMKVNIEDLNDNIKEREQEKDAMLKEINQQAECIEEQRKEIERLSAEEDNYKKLQFAFEVEGKRLQELQNELDSLGNTCSNSIEELEQLKINYEQKVTESKIIKEEFEAYMQRHAKTNDIQIENEKQKQNLEQQIIQLRLANENLTATNLNLEQSMQKISLNIQNLHIQLEQKDAQISKLIRKEEKNNRKNQENLFIIRSELEQLQASEKQKQEENIKLKQKIKKIENESFLQLEEFKNQLESYYNNIILKFQGENNLESQKEQCQIEILSLKKKICGLESDHSLLTFENQRILRDLQEKNDEIDILFNRLKEIEILKSQLSQQIQEVEVQRKYEIESSTRIYDQ